MKAGVTGDVQSDHNVVIPLMGDQVSASSLSQNIGINHNVIIDSITSQHKNIAV